MNIMKTIKIYDSALCCPTGLCGVNIDPELMRIAIIVETLKQKGIIIERFNLRDHPEVYLTTKVINDALALDGSEIFPIITIDGDIVLKKAYPSNAQIADWLQVTEEELTIKK